MVDFILIDMGAGLPTSGQISTSLLMPGALEKQFGGPQLFCWRLRESSSGLWVANAQLQPFLSVLSRSNVRGGIENYVLRTTYKDEWGQARVVSLEIRKCNISQG
jgi:hypothetical protein